MAFKATNVVPQKAYEQVKGAAAQLKGTIPGVVSHMANNSIGLEDARNVYFMLKRAHDQLDSLKSTPGLPAYAQAQENDGTYDVAAEFTALLTNIQTGITWIENNVPATVSLAPASQWTTSGTLSDTAFTPAQTAGLRTALNTIEASIA